MGTINLSYTLDDAVKVRILDAICYENGYTDEVYDEGTKVMIPNPVTKGNYFITTLKNYFKNTLKRYENKQVTDTAVTTKEAEIDGIVITSS